MITKCGFSDFADAGVSRGPQCQLDSSKFKGRFNVELLRAKRDIFGEPIPGEFEEPELLEIFNAATTVGVNKVLDTAFGAVSPITTWYAGLIDNTSWSAAIAADTITAHSGWIEATGYSGNRPTWTLGAAASGSVTNAAAMVFNITGNATIHDIFITGGGSAPQTPGATTGQTLWATAQFGSTVSVSNGDQLRVTYTLSAT